MVVRDEGAILPAKGDVADPNGDGVGLFGPGLGVFPDTKEVIESNVGEVGNGKLERAALLGAPGLGQEVLGDGDGDS